MRSCRIGILILLCVHMFIGACYRKNERSDDLKSTSGIALLPGGSNWEKASRKSLTVIDIVPGKFIGPIGLGMPFEELKSIDSFDRSEPPDVNEVIVAYVGPIRVLVEKNVVVFAEVTIDSAQIRVTGKAIPRSASLEEVAIMFPECGTLERHEGANVIRCSSGKMRIAHGSARASKVTVQLVAE